VQPHEPRPKTPAINRQRIPGGSWADAEKPNEIKETGLGILYTRPPRAALASARWPRRPAPPPTRDRDGLAAASFLSVRGCVARTLLELADYIGKDAGRGRIRLDQRISRKDLAAMAEVARENVSRVLSDLRKRGIIEQYSQSYVLNDIRALEREVHH
jgi:hypothetical protein